MLEPALGLLRSKTTLAILLTLLISLELVRGFLKNFPAYCRTLKPKSFLQIAGLATLTALLLFPFDVFLIGKVQAWAERPWFQELISLGAFFGKAHNTWVLIALFYFLFWTLHKSSRKIFCFGALVSSSLTGLLSHILKHILMRARPYNNLGPFDFFDWRGLARDTAAFQSFPSGDVAICAGAASFLFFAARKTRLGWIFLIIPILTACARMSVNRHWPSDTAFAIVISFAVAKFVYDYMNFSEGKKN